MKSWTDAGFRDYRGERGSENIAREAHVRRAHAAPPGVVRVYYTLGKKKTSTSTSTRGVLVYAGTARGRYGCDIAAQSAVRCLFRVGTFRMCGVPSAVGGAG